jgi:hypothetical protein
MKRRRLQGSSLRAAAGGAAVITLAIVLARVMTAAVAGPNPGPNPSPSHRWMLGPFERAASAPVISPNAASEFPDPITGRQVRWEALHTFNPAAVVRNGKVDLLYRAEDDSGKMSIGGHTSRLGLAESADGIHFVPRADPAFYPAADEQEPREWPGGVEDPRIVESEDGLSFSPTRSGTERPIRSASPPPETCCIGRNMVRPSPERLEASMTILLTSPPASLPDWPGTA